jgi:hypothetical protein
MTFSELWTGINEFYEYERSTFLMWSEVGWEPIEAIEKNIEGFKGYIMKPSTPVILEEGENLILRASYLFVNRVTGSGNTYSARIPVFPSLDQNISRFDIVVRLPVGSKFLSATSDINFTERVTSDIPLLEYEAEEITPFANVNASIDYTPSLEDDRLFDVEEVTRTIIVKGGSLQVEDRYVLVNVGPVFFSFDLKLPSNARNVKARDGVGTLSVITSEADESLDVSVTPRYTVGIWNRLVATVSYSVPKREHISNTGDISILIYPNNDFPHYIRDLKVIVGRPEVDAIHLNYGATLPWERPDIETEIPPASIIPTIRPFAIGFGVVVIVAAVVILNKREKPWRAEPVVKVEAPKLEELVEKQRERLMILRELELLEAEREADKVKKEDYDQRVAELTRRLGRLIGPIRSLTRDLEGEPEIQPQLREIRRAERELEKIDEDLKNLEIRLRARRISRSDYERRKESRIKRRSRTIKRIEKALQSLGG